MFFKKISIFSIVIFTATKLYAAEDIGSIHQLNYFTGNFDFSDDKQQAILLAFNIKMKI